MSIFLSAHESLKYWRSTAPYYYEEVMVSPVENAPFDEAVSLLRKVNHLGLAEFADEDGRLELLVPDSSRRSRGERIKSRCIGTKLPDYSFYQVSNSIYACCPELLLTLAASTCSIIETISLACELCGTYSITEGKPLKHDPITSVADIARFLEQASGLKGRRALMRALPHIREGSASPRETDLYMMFCLPSSLGGFALDGVELNHSLPIPERLQSETEMRSITPDLYWADAELAIEYESDENHIDLPQYMAAASASMRLRHTNDSIRRRTYEALKAKVITVTNGEFIRFSEVERIAHMVARLIGKHGLHDSPRIYARRVQLHEWLRVPSGERDPFVES